MQHFLDRPGGIATIATLPYIRNMQKSGTFQPNIDKSGLHAGQHSFDTSQVHIVDNPEMAATLDVKLLHYSLLHYCNAGFLRGNINENLFIHGMG